MEVKSFSAAFASQIWLTRSFERYRAINALRRCEKALIRAYLKGHRALLSVVGFAVNCPIDLESTDQSELINGAWIDYSGLLKVHERRGIPVLLCLGEDLSKAKNEP